MLQETRRRAAVPLVPLVAVVAVLAAALALLATVPRPPASAAPVAVAAPAPAPWKAFTGITFNWPIGTHAERTRIVRRIHDAIDHTPAGETIRIATYNIGLEASADKLIAARRRGVRVQVIVNANLVGRIEARMQRVLGSNPGRTSFLYVCRNACRNASPAGNLHMKVYSFTRTGATTKLLISSSSNLGGPAMHGQWNDSVAIAGDVGLFGAWWQIFEQLRRDRTATPRRVNYVSDAVTAYFQRPVEGSTGRVTTSRIEQGTGDPAYRRLQEVSCSAPPGYGTVDGKTVIIVNMRAWYGARGEDLARLLARRRAYGCHVRVIGSLMSSEVVRILVRGRIPVRAADWDWGPRPSTSDPDDTVYGPSCYAHLKYVTVNGSYRGRGDRLVWTGSENWSPPGYSSDEVTLELHGTAVVKTYNDQFLRMWNNRRVVHRVGIQPTSRPCA